jgi:hypothetical protein
VPAATIALLGLATVAVAQRIVSPPEVSPPPVPSQPPSPSGRESREPQQSQARDGNQPTNADQRGTENSPVIVQLHPTPKTQAEAEQDAKDRDEKAANDRETSATNRNLIIIGFLQLAVFAGQLLVFGYQALKLHQTIITMRKIANSQSADTRQAMIAAERSYVSVRLIRLTAISSSADKITALHAMVILENTGNTPTKKMIYHNSMQIFDGDVPQDFDFPDLDQRRPRQSFIAPKTWVGAFNFAISREELIATQAGQRRIFVWGWADYDDTFAGTARHRTEFCHEIFALAGVPLAGHAEHWARASQYWRHNAADDECQRSPKPYNAA